MQFEYLIIQLLNYNKSLFKKILRDFGRNIIG